MENRLYVGNLSFDASEEDIQDLFGQAGEVAEVVIMKDKFSGRSRGFAFVSMRNPQDAQKAIDMFNEQEFAGRKLQINIARPKEERAERGGGFRGNSGAPRRGGFGGGRGGHGGSRGGHGGGRREFSSRDRGGYSRD